jgi:hypothetical protein
MSDMDIHNYQDSSFPKMKAPMEQGEHPDHHLPQSTVHRIDSSVEKPQTTETGTKKKVKFPFKGANS